MKETNKLEKSRGVILFAFNTDKVNYIDIALKSAKLIKKFLEIPICIITDQDFTSKDVDKVIKVDNEFNNYRSVGINWRNGDRYRAYELSPFSETILLDSDYIILDKNLLKLFNINLDYKLFYSSHFFNDIGEHTMGPMSLQYIWATALVFKKTEKSRALFTLVNKIQHNYEFYRKLFNIPIMNYRNDFAFTIANHVINGYCTDNQYNIPWSLLTLERKITSIKKKDNTLLIRDKDKVTISPLQSLHVLDKEYLMSDDFNELVNHLCQDKLNT